MAAFRALAVARGELGVVETPGRRSTPRIEGYLRTTRGVGSTDSIPWCSAFVNFCVEKTGLVGTKRRAARSWLKWGVALEAPREGCIVVLWRGRRDGIQGHVGFFVHQEGDRVVLLGGNQANKVCERAYPVSRVLGYRWSEGG